MSRFRGTLWIAIFAIVMVVLVVMAEWLNTDAAMKPKSLVSTINGDARLNRAFTWYTDNPQAATVLQIIKGGGVQSFNDSNMIEFTGTATTIETGTGRAQGVHSVLATNLEPGTEYLYRVGSGKDKGWSEPASFMTEADDTGTFTFINIADSQGVTEQDFALWGRTLDKAFATFPDARFIIHNGDLTEDPEDEPAWDHFFGKARNWLRQIPLMPVTGNHDEVDGVADRYISHFYLPDNGATGSTPGTTYSFDYGSAHVVVLNSESNIDQQTQWLRNDLAQTDKPWKIVAMHQGAYGGNTYKKVEKWVTVFDQFAVDLVLQGHNHEYSRSYPLRNGRIVSDGEGPIEQGTVYVVTNTAGPKFNEKKEDRFYHKVHFQNGKQMFAGITIEGLMLTYRAYDVEGKEWDRFVLQHRK